MSAEELFRAAVLVVSDRVAAGNAEDKSGSLALAKLVAWRMQVVHRETVPDDDKAIRERLLQYADHDRLDLVITSGGTGFGRRDVTPEATRAVLERDAPGLSELLRRETSKHTPYAALSRGVSGVRGKTLIVNLPGSPAGVEQSLDVLGPLLPHALRLLQDREPGHPLPDCGP